MAAGLPTSSVIVGGIGRIGLILVRCLLVLLLLALLAYLEEDWWGAHRWAVCQRELQTKGESLDWSGFVPPRVPNESNFAMAPLFVRELNYARSPSTGIYTFGPGSKRPAALKDMPYGGPKPTAIRASGYEMGRPTDLEGYARFYRQAEGFPHAGQAQSPADDVLLALTRYAPALDEFAEAAAQRPVTRFPTNWQIDNPMAMALPHYNLLQQFASTLRLRACARLAGGHTAEAADDLELALRPCRDIRRDPNIIAHLVEITCLRMVLGTVWDGLARRDWHADELARLQSHLGSFDLLADYVHTVRGNRAVELRAVDYLKEQRDVSFLWSMQQEDSTLSEDDKLVAQATGKVVPPGWFDLNKATMALWEQEYCIGGTDPDHHRSYPEKKLAGTRAINALPDTRLRRLSRYMVRTINEVSKRSASAQTALDEAVIACALERYFLDRQAYPDRLEALVPSYLERVPNDIASGGALHYHLTQDGRYQIYSVGWNERDDGGKVAWNNARAVNVEQGDWVWQYTEVEPPPPPEHPPAATK